MKPAPSPCGGFPAYAFILALLAASRGVRPEMARLMEVGVISEAQLTTLVALHTWRVGCPSTELLSARTGIHFSHLPLVIDSLVARKLVRAYPTSLETIQCPIRLTKRGREAAIVTIHLFLEAADTLLRDLLETDPAALETVVPLRAYRAQDSRGHTVDAIGIAVQGSTGESS